MGLTRVQDLEWRKNEDLVYKGRKQRKSEFVHKNILFLLCVALKIYFSQARKQKEEILLQVNWVFGTKRCENFCVQKTCTPSMCRRSNSQAMPITHFRQKSYAGYLMPNRIIQFPAAVIFSDEACFTRAVMVNTHLRICGCPKIPTVLSRRKRNTGSVLKSGQGFLDIICWDRTF